MKTRAFPSAPEARSPAGAEIRYLMGGTTGDMIQSTVPAFICVTMPPWRGDDEATIIEGPWEPNAPLGW